MIYIMPIEAFPFDSYSGAHLQQHVASVFAHSRKLFSDIGRNIEIRNALITLLDGDLTDYLLRHTFQRCRITAQDHFWNKNNNEKISALREFIQKLEHVSIEKAQEIGIPLTFEEGKPYENWKEHDDFAQQIAAHLLERIRTLFQ